MARSYWSVVRDAKEPLHSSPVLGTPTKALVSARGVPEYFPHSMMRSRSYAGKFGDCIALSRLPSSPLQRGGNLYCACERQAGALGPARGVDRHAPSDADERRHPALRRQT